MRIPWFVSFMVEDDFRLYFCANFEYAMQIRCQYVFTRLDQLADLSERTDNTVVVFMLQ